MNSFQSRSFYSRIFYIARFFFFFFLLLSSFHSSMYTYIRAHIYTYIRTYRFVYLFARWLAHIQCILFHDTVYYLLRFIWRIRIDVSRVVILFEASRFLATVRYFRHAERLHHDAADTLSSMWLQIVQVSSTTNQVLWTARLSRNPDVCVHTWPSLRWSLWFHLLSISS